MTVKRKPYEETKTQRDCGAKVQYCQWQKWQIIDQLYLLVNDIWGGFSTILDLEKLGIYIKAMLSVHMLPLDIKLDKKEAALVIWPILDTSPLHTIFIRWSTGLKD